TETHALRAGHRGHDVFGEAEGGFRHVCEVGAESSLSRGRRDHGRVRVPEQHGAPAHGEVGEGATLAVPDGDAVATHKYGGQIRRQVVLAERSAGKDREGSLGRLRHSAHMPKASRPVMSRPTISVWMSCVPSY